MMADPPPSNTTELADALILLTRANDTAYFLTCAYACFFMQAGFVMLEAGKVRHTNTVNILLKNLIDAAVCALAFFVCGYGFAFGDRASDDGNAFIGSSKFFLGGLSDDHLAHFLLHVAYMSTAATIVSGCMAERTVFVGYVSSSTMLALWTYPIAAHWMWSPHGWLYKLGAIDVSGGCIVHCVGGTVGLMGAYFLGPRMNRFDDSGKPREVKEHSIPLQVLGTMILSFGWFSFNSGSTATLGGHGYRVAAKSAVITLLGGAAGCVTMLLVGRYRTGLFSITTSLEGLLSGLVAVTAGCAVIEPYAALIVGMVSALVVSGLQTALLKLKIDDPLSNSPIHLGAGGFGMLCTGIFATKRAVCEFQFLDDDNCTENYRRGVVSGGFVLLGVQTLALFVVILWSAVLAFAMFWVLKKYNFLRVDQQIEMAGIDNPHHGSPAYDMR